MRLGDIAKKSSLKLKMISEEELVDLHKVLLLMLDDLIEICKRNNLHFILIGGSAIGALRDKGFIPWDDDIDIAMPRRDFEKLYKIIKKQYSFKYSMLHPQDKENYGRILPKIRLKGTEYKTILEYDLNESGIFIDIYTIENIPDSKIKKWGQGIICMFMGFALSCRRMAKGYKIFKNYQNGISFKVKALIGSDEESNTRFMMWALALKNFKENPLIGIGWNGYKYQFYHFLYNPAVRAERYAYLNAHNVYLQLLCETGILGFLIFMSGAIELFVRTLKLLKKNIRDSFSIGSKGTIFFVLTMQIFFWLYSLTGNCLYDTMFGFYSVSIGFVLGYLVQKKNIKEEIYNEKDRNINIS